MALTIWLAALLAAAATFARAAPASLDAYGQLPSIEDVRISPDGRLLAKVTTENEQRAVVVQGLDAGGTAIRMAAGSLKLRDIAWAGPDHLIITASTTGSLGPSVISRRSEWFRAVDFNWSKKTLRPIAWRPPLDVIDGPPVIRFLGGRPIAYVQGFTFVHDHGRPALLKVDLDAGVTTVEALGFPNTDRFAVGSNGDVIAQTQFDAEKNRWSLDLLAHGQWQEVQYAESTIESPVLLGLGRDGSSIAVEFGSDDGDVIRELRPNGQDWSNPYPVESSEELIWDSATYKLIAEGGLRGDQRIYHFFDAGDQHAWDNAVSTFTGSPVELISMTDDHRKFVVRAETPAEGPAYFIVDAAARKARLIGSEYAGLRPDDIAAVRPLAFKAADGLALTGYLTLPPGKPATGLPLVVFPHGGPAARDEPGFDWWSQAMASRGYAVLQVNFRGSQGLGWSLESAGFGEWGRKMQTDLSDGVSFLVAQGIVDPKRVCIVGASYGGYAALAGATLDGGPYRCAVSVAGISDLSKFIAYSKGRQGALAQRYWMRFMGDKVPIDDLSPARRVDRVSVPILLIHGKDDVIVPYKQSEIMADALTRAGKPFEFVTLKNEDHWLSRSATRLQMLEAVVAFLNKNNPA